MLLAAAWLLTKVAYAYPPPSLGLVVAGGFALVVVLTLAIVRYDVAVAIGFVLSGVVIGVPTPSDLILCVVIVAAAATGRLKPQIPLAALASLGLFVAINVLSTAAATDLQTASNYLLIVILLAIVASWLSGYVDCERRARIVAGSYLAAALVAATIGTLALFAPIPGREIFLYGVDETVSIAGQGMAEGLRARALFDDPNVFGPFLMPIALILLEDLLTPRLFGFNRLLKAAMLCVLVIGLVFSASRGAWLSLTVALVVFMIVLGARRRGSRRLVPLLVNLVAAAMLIGGVVSLAGDQSSLTERAGVQDYDVSRFDAQQQGIELAWEHPFGVGPGQFEHLASYGGEPTSAHSLFVRALAEEGVLGLAALLTLALATLVYALRAAVQGKSLYGIGSAALLAAWCGILVHSYFVDSLQWRHAWLVAALIWATAMVGRRERSEPLSPDARPPPVAVAYGT